MANAVANQFELWGRGIHVSYSTSSISGKPLFHYRAYGVDKAFSGDDIRVEETALGREVSVTLEAIPDLATSTFTVLIPRVNIGDDPSARFRSVGIHADHFTSIGGPALVRGAQASYDGTDLHGVARAVVF